MKEPMRYLNSLKLLNWNTIPIYSAITAIGKMDTWIAHPRSEGHRGSLDGKGGTYPAEMIGDKVQLGNISFSIGSREER